MLDKRKGFLPRFPARPEPAEIDARAIQHVPALPPIAGNARQDDTGTQTFNGPPFNGELSQVQWYPTTADTGGDVDIFLATNPDDTGDSILVLTDNDSLGQSRVWVPRQYTHDLRGSPDQTDTGTPAAPAPFVSAGSKLRVLITPGGAAVAGKLRMWTKN